MSSHREKEIGLDEDVLEGICFPGPVPPSIVFELFPLQFKDREEENWAWVCTFVEPPLFQSQG